MSKLSYQAAKYEDQLPKKKNVSFAGLFNYIAGSASILAIIVAPNFFPQEKISLVYSIGLIGLVGSLLIHTYRYERRKLHRFANSTIYIHYINHVIRDGLASFENKNFSDVEEISQTVIDSIADCYSLLVGKRCRCTLKELNDDLSVKTVIRDSIAKKRQPTCETQDKGEHLIEDNTDFYNLWYSLEGCSRYFFSNDLIKLFKKGTYKNSSFKILNKPQLIPLGLFTIVSKWTLPYKSTIVLPIRYFSEFQPPVEPKIRDTQNVHKYDYHHWKFWGFLCIDCNWKNVFDEEFAPGALRFC